MLIAEAFQEQCWNNLNSLVNVHETSGGNILMKFADDPQK